MIDPRIGQHIGNYQITEEINRGGYGVVYKAKQTLTGEVFAIKFLQNYRPSNEERNAFFKEAQLLEGLKHPFILSLVEVNIAPDNTPYILMEYAPKGSLADRLRSKTGLLPEKEVLSTLSQIGQALQYIHEQHNMTHCDVKPDNILFNAQGEALLADFGVSLVMATLRTYTVGRPLGSPPYMSPEQWSNKVSSKSDQYALGCLAYELFTGERPFKAAAWVEFMWKHVNEPPVLPTTLRPHLFKEVEYTILKAMAKRTEDRYADVAAFLKALFAPFLASTVVLKPLVLSDPIKQVSWTVSDVVDGTVLDGEYYILGKSYEIPPEGEAQRAKRAGVNYRILSRCLPVPNTHNEADRRKAEAQIVESIQLLCRLRHPSLLALCTAFRNNDEFFLIEEDVSGESIQAILNENGVIEEKRAITWGLQICDALSYLHAEIPSFRLLEFNFRDFDQIVVTPEDKVYITSLGILNRHDYYSKIHRRKHATNLAFVEYFPPEWIRQGDLSQDDIRSSVYYVGAMLYRLFIHPNGQFGPLPLPAFHDGQIPLGSMLSKNPSLHTTEHEGNVICPVEQVILKAIHPDPDERFQSLEAFKEALEQCLYI